MTLGQFHDLRHFELTVPVTLDCQLQIHEEPQKQEQFAYSDKPAASGRLL